MFHASWVITVGSSFSLPHTVTVAVLCLHTFSSGWGCFTLLPENVGKDIWLFQVAVGCKLASLPCLMHPMQSAYYHGGHAAHLPSLVPGAEA